MAYGDTIFQDADATGFDWWNWYDQTAGLGGFQEPQMPGTPPDVVQMDPFVVSEPAGTSFEDYLSGIGPSNIFDYGAGAITPGAGTPIVPPSRPNYLQPLEVQSEIEKLFNDILQRRNAARAEQNQSPVSSIDREEISSIWDDVLKQQDDLWDLAQRDLDRVQEARRRQGINIPLVIPLAIPAAIASIWNISQLDDILKGILDLKDLPTPETPSEVAARGGDLSQIGAVSRSGTIGGSNVLPPMGTIPSILSEPSGIFDSILNAPTNLAGAIGGILGGIGSIAQNPSGVLGGGGGSTPTQNTGTTTPIVVTPGATGGNTGTGSSTPSVTNPAGTDTTSGISLSGAQPSDMGPFGLPGGDNPLVIGQESPEQKAAREAAESQAAQARTDAAAVTQQQIDAAKQRESEAAARAQQERETLLRIMGENQIPTDTTGTNPNQPIGINSSGLPDTGTGPFGLPNGVDAQTGVDVMNRVLVNVGKTGQPSTDVGGGDGSNTTVTTNIIQTDCPAGQERVNGQCVAKCGPGQERINGQCVAQCPPGQVRINGVCQVAPAGPNNPPGPSGPGSENPQEPTNVILNPIAGECPDGQEKVNGQCVARCPAGQVRNAAGVCVVSPGITNNPSVNPTENPTKDDNVIFNPFNEPCPEGQERVNGQCVARCPAGQVRNAEGVCVVQPPGPGVVVNPPPPPPPPPPQCEEGYELVNGKCVPKVIVNPPPPPPPPPPGTTTTIFTIPTSTYTPSLMATTPAQRNILTEGTTTTAAFTQLAPQFSNMYGGLATGYQREDEDRLYRMAMGGSPFAQAQLGLTGMASAQTQAANQALRAGNLADVQAMQAQALAARRAANPELYGALGQLTQQAQQQAASDYGRMQTAGQLSAEDIRNAQQAAREAYGARGQAMSKGAVGAEILNRQQLQQQREQQARQNYQQSLGNLGAATQMQTANLFDPFSTLLGQQYGMQSQNVGTTQGLFGQAGALASGGLSYAPVVQTYNPFGVYPQDVYGTNVNALNADQIAAANRQAALEAAKLGQTGTYAQALGSFLGTQTGQNSINSIVDFIRRSVGG